MDLSLIRFSAPQAAAPNAGPPAGADRTSADEPPAGPSGMRVGPEIVTDILWATATPADHLEHVRARSGPRTGTVDVALFHRRIDEHCETNAVALGLCRRAIANAPLLAGWTAEPLPHRRPF